MSRFDKQWEADLEILGDGLREAFERLPAGTDIEWDDVKYLARGHFGGWRNAQR